jgi:heme oxygenase
MNAPPADALLTDLRTSTRPLHDDIEALLALEGPMDLGRYQAIISGFHGFLRQWEQDLLVALPPALQDWFAERRRARFAADDLAYLATLGLPERHAEPAAQPALPDASLASVFGSLYVIEGSALGGQVITPRLQRDMGLAPGRGASYFHGYGPRTGAMWREFREKAVAEVGSEPAGRRAATEAAQATFGALIQTFRPLLAA